MRQKPKAFTYYSTFLLILAAGFPVQIMFMFGHAPWEFMAIFAKLTSVNLAVMAGAVGLAILSKTASPHLKWCIPMFLIILTMNNYLVATYALNYSMWSAIGGVLLVVGAHGILAQKDALKVLLRPNLRWWLTPVRKQVNVNTFVRPVTGEDFSSQTYDISLTGAYISTKIDELGSLQGADGFELGDRCNVKLKLDQLNSLNLTGEVVRKATQDGVRPEGFAVRFLHMSGLEKRTLKSFLDRQVLATPGRPPLAMA